MNVQWVKVSDDAESWHIVEDKFVSRASVPLVTTACRRVANADLLVEDRPRGEKTCESCFRALELDAVGV